MVIHRPSCRDQRLHLRRDVDHVDRGAAVEELRGEGRKAGRRRGAAASAQQVMATVQGKREKNMMEKERKYGKNDGKIYENMWNDRKRMEKWWENIWKYVKW